MQFWADDFRLIGKLLKNWSHPEKLNQENEHKMALQSDFISRALESTYVCLFSSRIIDLSSVSIEVGFQIDALRFALLVVEIQTCDLIGQEQVSI